MQETFLELIKDKTKSAEDIYNIMFDKYKDYYSTKKIIRGLSSWNNAIYQGTIGESDFVVSEASSTSLDGSNVKMIYDNYKNMIIKFIELFREAYENNPDQHIIPLIILISPQLLSDVFAGSTRNGELATKQRNEASSLDTEDLMKQYKISSQMGRGRSSVCCERNVTIGNIFQFVGIETYHVSGFLTKGFDDTESHAFTLIKYGKGVGKYALFDIFNGIVVQNVLPGDYDFSKGFRIKHYIERRDETVTYQIDGPLYEITDEVLKTEAYIRKLARELSIIEKKIETNDFSEESRLESLRQEFDDLKLVIQSSSIDEALKERYTSRIETFYLKKISKLDKIVKSHLNSEESSI